MLKSISSSLGKTCLVCQDICAKEQYRLWQSSCIWFPGIKMCWLKADGPLKKRQNKQIKKVRPTQHPSKEQIAPSGAHLLMNCCLSQSLAAQSRGLTVSPVLCLLPKIIEKKKKGYTVWSEKWQHWEEVVKLSLALKARLWPAPFSTSNK